MSRKDDPIYYREKIKELLKQAKENNIDISLINSNLSFTSYIDKDFAQKYGIKSDTPTCRASINIKIFIESEA